MWWRMLDAVSRPSLDDPQAGGQKKTAARVPGRETTHIIEPTLVDHTAGRYIDDDRHAATWRGRRDQLAGFIYRNRADIIVHRPIDVHTSFQQV